MTHKQALLTALDGKEVAVRHYARGTSPMPLLSDYAVDGQMCDGEPYKNGVVICLRVKATGDEHCFTADEFHRLSIDPS